MTNALRDRSIAADCLINSMGKNAQARRKKRKETLTPETPTTTKKQSLILRIASQSWTLVSAVALVVGLIVGYFALRPHVTVSAKSVVDSTNPFSVALEITNQSYFTLYHVRQRCELVHATLRGGYLVGRTLNANPKVVANRLEPGHPATSFCNIDVDTPPNMDAEIRVTVFYPFLTGERSESFRFVYQQGSNGLFWFPASN